MHACFCEHVETHLHDPTVARLVDRLRDELTVLMLRASGRAALPEARVRGDDRRRMLAALAFGRMTLGELVAEVYPEPTADPEEAALRYQRVKTICSRLAIEGVLTRPRRGVYALAGMRTRRTATMDDCRRVLADPRVNPPGLTAREIAARLDIPLMTIRKWLERLRDRGAPLRAVPAPPAAGGYRYRIDESAA